MNIDWQTANEINTDYFLVQRSKNGTTWETIQKATAVGSNANSNTNYTAEDQNPYNGISFYRLIEVDRDGKQTNSDVKKVSIEIFLLTLLYIRIQRLIKYLYHSQQ